MSSQQSTTVKNPQDEQTPDTDFLVSPKVEDDVDKMDLVAVKGSQHLSAPEDVGLVPPSEKTGTATDNFDRGVQTQTSELQNDLDSTQASTNTHNVQRLSETQNQSLSLRSEIIKHLESMHTTIRSDQQADMQIFLDELSMRTSMQVKSAIASMREGQDDTNSERGQCHQILEAISKLDGLLRGFLRNDEIKKLEGQLVQLRDNFQTVVDQKIEFEDQNRELQEEKKDLQLRLKRTEIELARSRRAAGPLANPNKTSDSIIQSEWRQLHYKIQQLAHHLAQCPPSIPLSEEACFSLRRVHRSYQVGLQRLEERTFILQGYLWRAVRPEFEFEHRAWGTKYTCEFKKLRRECTGKEFHAQIKYEEGS